MQIEELAAKLENLGLSGKEAKVYVANLFLGPSPVQKIAEQAGINRATTYVILDQLAAIGLVSQSSESKKTLFVAQDPEELDRLFEQQQKEIIRRRQELKKILPELKNSERVKQPTAPVVRFYHGLEGIQTINSYIRRKSRPGITIYGLMNNDEVRKVFPAHIKQNPELRLKKKLASKVLYSSAGDDFKSDAKLLRQTIKLAKPVKADITLYEDRASLLTYHGQESIGVLIESKDIVSALRQLFEMAWENQSKKNVKKY